MTESQTSTKRRTWTALGATRRIPSEYEIVTHDTNYTVRANRDAPLEQNPSSVANLWLITYRDKSPLQAPDWLGFRDPDEVTYRSYVTAQHGQEVIAAGILERYSDAGRDRELSARWCNVLATLFTPLRFPLHGLQMCTAYLGQMAPSSYITNCAAFAAADLLRCLSLVAYRTRELQRAFPELGFGTQERARWQTDPGWQPIREAIELALTAYDWAESFTAVNLILRATLDDVWLHQLAELARLNHDEETWLLLSGLRADAARCQRWTIALARYAIEKRADNRAVFRTWVDRWTPRARRAAAAYGEASAQALDGQVSAASVEVSAEAARNRTLAESGLV